MRILAISYCLPPMAFPQAIQIGRLLAHSSLSISAVSGGGLADAQFAARVDHHIVPLDERSGVLHKLAVRTVPFYGTAPDSLKAWAKAAYAKIESLVETQGKPDLIVTFGEPMSDHVLGLRLKQKYNIPWLAHFSDPWSDNPFRKYQPLSKLVNRALERQIVALADATAFTSQETVDLVFSKYGQDRRQRASVLPHAYDPNAYGSPSDEPQSGQVFLRYIGNFYGHRSPRPLIAALAELGRTDPRALDDVRVELVGGIPARMLRSSEWGSLPEGLLVTRGSVSYDESLRLMKSSDILLTIDAPARLSVFFPSKLVDYIGSGRRLVGIVPPGAAARIINESGGRSVSPMAPVFDIAALLRNEINDVKAQLKNRGAQTRRGNSTNRYDISNVAPIFDALCHSTIERVRALSGSSS